MRDTLGHLSENANKQYQNAKGIFVVHAGQ